MLKTNFNSPNSSDTEFVKKRAWHDHGILIADEKDPRLPWPLKEALRMVGKCLFGPRKHEDK